MKTQYVVQTIDPNGYHPYKIWDSVHDGHTNIFLTLGEAITKANEYQLRSPWMKYQVIQRQFVPVDSAPWYTT